MTPHMGSVVEFRSRIAIVDRDQLMAEALAQVLSRVDHLVEILDPTEAASRPPRADVVVVVVRSGSRLASPAALVRAVARQGTDVVVVAEPECSVEVAECVEAGAVGVVHTTDTLGRLMDVAADVRGGAPLGAGERDQLLADLRRHRSESDDRVAVFDRLTPRERHVLGQLMDGRSAAEIAKSDFVAIETVRTHIKAVLRKLRVSSQVAAVSLAYQNGWRDESAVSNTEAEAEIA